ncbi:ceramide-1-phosphate transfer protein-like [Pollicipes pollicipes]|uniref:ceramide-1-phosphate transfer protein-like n=1 Tax=Pollicipes pollicipes TaxID=41117 RepID=UPI0018850025|nr:ceramide-1-phosphate transfer protein-like [Pollicipes pollicipes]XP_037076001.1 ceramide-1-phosphate transfer protein-like [Pollicipes pollicipes]
MSGEKDVEDTKFDIAKVLANFKKCREDNVGSLTLEGYIAGYHELHKFFGQLGAVFGFVGSDVQQKLVQLECLRKSGAAESYVTVQAMMDYEKNNGILESDKAGNGCRTLLRLHRALAFIADFLRELHDRADEQKMASVCQDSYKRTLAVHHPWLVQKGALLAMYTLGTRGDIVAKAVGEDPAEREQGKATLLECVDTMQDVYNTMQGLYEANGLADLP